ncbi:MAG: hypothetical protein LBP55_08855 [Candidatus Adiutrix sp.]|jgi:hypothetical protein|nr:hypothetical protein [Candidatus Adiutrix sp.]
MLKTCFKSLALAAIGLALCPDQALAYLDPGTGNLFIYVTVSLLGAAAFMVKGLGYWFMKLARRKAPADGAASGADDLVIFSEGKIYWHTFKPIIEALLARGQSFRYLTMDIEDPALTLEHRGLDNRYIGQGSAAFARLAAVRAKIMLSTTPNIGTPGYPLRRPPHVQCLVHVFHGVCGLETYHKYAVDNYDVLLLRDDGSEPPVRKLETLRGLKPKECVSLGLPYLDELKARSQAMNPGPPVSGAPVILIAPSWGDKGNLAVCIDRYIPQLLEAGYEVIARPHPQSFQSEPELTARLAAEFASKPNFRLDREPDPSGSMSRAALLISDKSGIRLDFAFLYERPVITLSSPFLDTDYEAADMGESWDEKASGQIGLVAPVALLADIRPLAGEALTTKPPASLAAFREANVANFGQAGPAVAAWLIERTAI